MKKIRHELAPCNFVPAQSKHETQEILKFDVHILILLSSNVCDFIYKCRFHRFSLDTSNKKLSGAHKANSSIKFIDTYFGFFSTNTMAYVILRTCDWLRDL